MSKTREELKIILEEMIDIMNSTNLEKAIEATLYKLTYDDVIRPRLEELNHELTFTEKAIEEADSNYQKASSERVQILDKIAKVNKGIIDNG